MTLALAHSHAVPAFNGLYYATIATVIPVLFLATAIQGNLFRDLIEASARSAENSRARGRYPLGEAEERLQDRLCQIQLPATRVRAPTMPGDRERIWPASP